MSNPDAAQFPLPGRGPLQDPDAVDLGAVDLGDATTESDGEEMLDPDLDDDLIDSAEADRIAAEGGTGPRSDDDDTAAGAADWDDDDTDAGDR